MKALLTLRGIPAPRTHDVQMLAELLPANDRSGMPPGELTAVNPFAVEVRYGGDWDEPRREEALHAGGLAERVRLAVRSNLPRECLV